MSPYGPPTDLREVEARAQITEEVRAELEQEAAQQVNVANAERALFVSKALGVLVGLPVLGASLGLAVRLFRWIAGL